MTDVSGISDITSYVAQLISLERQQGPAPLYEEEQQELTRRSASLADLRTNLTALNSQVQALMQPGTLSPFQAKTVTSSNTGVATGTASTSAQGGSHTLLVSQLAKQGKVVSSQLTRTDTGVASAVGAGTRSFSVTLAGVATTVDVAVAEGDDNETILENMAAAINGSVEGVTASVVADSASTVRLVITSEETGSEHAVTLADVTGSLLAATGTNSGVLASGTTGGALYASDALDAVFVLDGLSISRGSNTITDVLDGVTLKLLATQASGATPVTLSVGPDESAIRDKVQGFLDAYNTAIKFLKERTGTTVSTSVTSTGSTQVDSVTRGTLVDLPAYFGLMMNLRYDVGGQITTAASGGPASLAEIGITAASDGTLSISDSSKFTDALSESPAGVAALFNTSDGIASQVSARLTAFVQTGGILDNSDSAVTSQLSQLTSLIKAQDDLLEIRRETLTKQYTALLDVIAQINTQQNLLDAITSASG